MARMAARSWLLLLCLVGLVLSAQQSGAADPPAPTPPYAQSAVLYASDGAISAQFGHDIVAQDGVGQGTLAAVSAPRQHSLSTLNLGAVYLFQRGPDGWEDNGRLPDPPNVQTDWFGSVLALDGNTLAVRTSIVTATGSQGHDAVFVYRRVGDEWQPQVEPLLPDGDFSGAFGEALALNDNTLAVSASGQFPDDNGVTIFTRTGQTWTRQAWLPAPTGIDDWYPAALALHGNTLLVGSPYANDYGLVAIYGRSGSTWSLDGLLLPDADLSHGFGSALDFDGETGRCCRLLNQCP